jgi:H+/gluconate symporter-like permease
VKNGGEFAGGRPEKPQTGACWSADEKKRNKEVIFLITNVYLSGLFVILAIAVFIFLCFKNVHTGIAALISALIAALGSTNAFYVSIFEVFPSGVAELVEMMFFVFTMSGLLGFLMDETGCSRAVGNKMIKLLGTDRAWMAISATSIILMLAGVGTFIFVVVVVAAPLMKAANLPRKVGMIAAQGIAPAINFCMPVPNVPGSLPNMFLGTSLFDAPILSIATGILGIIMFLIYQTRLVKKARANGEGYDGEDVDDLDLDDSELPSFLTSVLPLVAVVVAAIVFSQIDLKDAAGESYSTWSTQLVALAQFVGCVVLAILHFPRCKKIGFARILSQGCTSMWGFLVLAGCVYGFGQVVTSCSAIAPVQEWALGLNLSPYISAMISVAVIAALCTDGITAMMIWLPLFGQQYLDMGVNAGALRRLLLCTTQTFDSLPHAQSVANTLGVFGLTHKQAYKELFITTVVFPTIFSIFCCICCVLFYGVA